MNSTELILVWQIFFFVWSLFCFKFYINFHREWAWNALIQLWQQLATFRLPLHWRRGLGKKLKFKGRKAPDIATIYFGVCFVLCSSFMDEKICIKSELYHQIYTSIIFWVNKATVILLFAQNTSSNLFHQDQNLKVYFLTEIGFLCV